jgi:hypothetical protein
LRIHKEEIVNDPHFLIDQALLEVNEEWAPGALDWMKRTRPSEFERMVTLEEEINRFALSRDMNRLNQALGRYKELMLGIAKAFKVPKGASGYLFHHGKVRMPNQDDEILTLKNQGKSLQMYCRRRWNEPRGCEKEAKES